MHYIYVLIIAIMLTITLVFINFRITRRKSYLYALGGLFFLLLAVLIILATHKIKSEYHIFAIVLVLYVFTMVMFVKSFLVRKKEDKGALEKEAITVSSQLQQIIEYGKKCSKVYGFWKWLLNRHLFLFTINYKNMEKKLPKLKIPNEVKNEISKEVSKGKTIIISEAPFQVENWVGDKYLIIDK